MGAYQAYAASNVTVKNSYLHGWTIGDEILCDWAHGGIIADASPGFIVDNCIISNTEYARTKNNGIAIRAGNISNTTIFDVASVGSGTCNVHDSIFYNISYPNVDFDSGVCPGEDFHTNGLYTTGNGCRVYNNLIYNFKANAAPLYPNPCTSGAGPNQDWTQYFYNNVIILESASGVPIAIDISPAVGGGGTGGYCGTVYLINNTIQSTSLIASVRSEKWVNTPSDIWYLNNLIIQNNHIINSDGSDTFCLGPPCVDSGSGRPQNLTRDYSDLFESNSTATAQGYVSGNNYAPAGISSGTVDAGTDVHVALSCTNGVTCLDKLGVIHPRGSGWDIGAYEYVQHTGDTTPPGAPTGLSIK